jgi:hypothetical protein
MPQVSLVALAGVLLGAAAAVLAPPPARPVGAVS